MLVPNPIEGVHVLLAFITVSLPFRVWASDLHDPTKRTHKSVSGALRRISGWVEIGGTELSLEALHPGCDLPRRPPDSFLTV